jgi:hypothetical protein
MYYARIVADPKDVDRILRDERVSNGFRRWWPHLARLGEKNKHVDNHESGSIRRTRALSRRL